MCSKILFFYSQLINLTRSIDDIHYTASHFHVCTSMHRSAECGCTWVERQLIDSSLSARPYIFLYPTCKLRLSLSLSICHWPALTSACMSKFGPTLSYLVPFFSPERLAVRVTTTMVERKWNARAGGGRVWKICREGATGFIKTVIRLKSPIFNWAGVYIMARRKARAHEREWNCVFSFSFSFPSLDSLYQNLTENRQTEK
jgi:hypothetical protein